MDYSKIKEIIQSAGMTYLPALLIVVVETALEKKVFREGQIQKVVRRIEDEYYMQEKPWGR